MVRRFCKCHILKQKATFRSLKQKFKFLPDMLLHLERAQNRGPRAYFKAKELKVLPIRKVGIGIVIGKADHLLLTVVNTVMEYVARK